MSDKMEKIIDYEKRVEAFLMADYEACNIPNGNFNAYAVGYLTRAVAMSIHDPVAATAFWSDKLNGGKLHESECAKSYGGHPCTCEKETE